MTLVCVIQPRSRVRSALSSSVTVSFPAPPSIASSASMKSIVPACVTVTVSLPASPSMKVGPTIVRTSITSLPSLPVTRVVPLWVVSIRKWSIP